MVTGTAVSSVSPLTEKAEEEVFTWIFTSIFAAE